MQRRRRPRKNLAFQLDLDVIAVAGFRETWQARFGDQADAAWRALAGQIRTTLHPVGYDPASDWRTVLPSLDEEEDPRLLVE